MTTLSPVLPVERDIAEFVLLLFLLELLKSLSSALLGPICRKNISVPSDTTEEKYLKTHCCQGKHNLEGKNSVTWFSCQAGCCGDLDNNQCCAEGGLTGGQIGSIAAGIVFVGFLIVIVIVMFRYKKRNEGDKDGPEHEKILEGVYSAETLDEIFTPVQPLVSAPGTIMHPVTTMNSLFTLSTEQSYVIPPLNQPQPPPITVTAPPGDNDSINFEDEENWEQWDGFSSADGVRNAAPAGGTAPSVGRGRDAPFFQGDDNGQVGDCPYYYDSYDRFQQPPPAYEAVAQTRIVPSAPS